MEYAYREWSFNNNHYRFQIFFSFIGGYLIVMIIKFNSANTLLPLIISCISLCLELTLLFFIRKYKEKVEIIMTLNQILLSVICEFYRIFAQKSNLWYLGYSLACMKLIIYARGNKFIVQTGLQVICQCCSFIFMEDEDVYFIVSHNLLTFLLVIFRYQLELINRKYFIASQSQCQYENLIQDLLPSWVVIVKYDKMQGQLCIDKINRNMQDKFDIKNDKCFREFLRNLKVLPHEFERQNVQFIKLEHTLIRKLQTNREDQTVERYHAFMDKKDSKTKQQKFKITQVFFKTFEPSIILLFEEIKEDKYDQLLYQVQQRDYTSCTNARISLGNLKKQIQLLKYLKSLIPQWFNGKQSQFINSLTSSIMDQIQNGYIMFNLNFDVLNLFKISHRQLKFEINQIQPSILMEQLCEDLQLSRKLINKYVVSAEFTEIIKTDKAKLISIIINLVEFCKILLSIIHGDDKILSQAVPLGSQIQIHLKQTKQQKNCIKISLTHPKLFISPFVRDLFANIETSIDHKKRNWSSRNYFEMINQLNSTFQQIYEYYKKDHKSTDLIDDDFHYLFQNQKSNLNISEESRGFTHQNNVQPQFQFNVLGYPMSQYLISQLGPWNKIRFKNRYQNFIQTPSQKSINTQNTKLQFLLYQDLNDFIQELNQLEKPILEIYQKKKLSNHDISQKFYYAQLASSPRKFG
ncbi:unnamed protein product (macronuclear) [Paramecium tetraurelia]|uniref:Transmembrane protein n=1 Tax=Paramecium tetraurelia TaxID=5888 RepID=A0CMZ9_PARTE|nr:uncharacterized protein GSPATT00008607001 [Paramecium tetraurelia]CAK72166.1 unnamed protein product [Paramecium tetraurelia]|eukprot:XP_001439563.1 hypothetical protein (macronuclear) [Paramecium tetraurelia strain d4-2]